MKKIVGVSLTILLILVLVSWAASAQGGRSRGRTFGVGIQYTINFPASGLSSRFWFADFVGFEGDLYPLTLPPGFAIRALLKAINTPMVDLYLGGGLGLDSTFAADLQISVGIEISPIYNFALSSEMGYAFLGGSVTAGFAAHYYF